MYSSVMNAVIKLSLSQGNSVREIKLTASVRGLPEKAVTDVLAQVLGFSGVNFILGIRTNWRRVGVKKQKNMSLRAENSAKWKMALRVVSAGGFSARNDLFFCLLTPTLRQLENVENVAPRGKFRSVESGLHSVK